MQKLYAKRDQNFQCPRRYKCHLSYCIPYRRLCDGTVDCLHADDENSCDAYTCSGLLHCRDHKFCVHQSEVCDTHLNCPLGDDEANCILPSCPRNCFCLQLLIWTVLHMNKSLHQRVDLLIPTSKHNHKEIELMEKMRIYQHKLHTRIYSLILHSKPALVNRTVKKKLFNQLKS